MQLGAVTATKKRGNLRQSSPVLPGPPLDHASGCLGADHLNVRYGSRASSSAIDGCPSTSAMPRLRPKSWGGATCCDGPQAGITMVSPSYARDAERYAFLRGTAEIPATVGVVEPRDEDPRQSRQRLPKAAPRRRVLGDVRARRTRATRVLNTLCHFG